jgi:hypothetical protein
LIEPISQTRAGESDPEATVIAGGQSLMPLLALRLAAPSMLVDLRRVTGLGNIAIDRFPKRGRGLILEGGGLHHSPRQAGPTKSEPLAQFVRRRPFSVAHDGGTRVAFSQPVLFSSTGGGRAVASHQQSDAITIMPKQMHLALDVSWTHLETAWRMPRSWIGRHYPDIGLFEDIARIAERGLFDMIFFGDGSGIPPRSIALSRSATASL